MIEQSHVVVRRLEQADVHIVLDIIRAVRLEYGLGNRVATILEPSDYALFDLYRRRRAAYFVAVAGKNILGGAGIAPLMDADWLTCELQRMYLRPEARGLGIGHRLLNACIAAAQSLNFARCYAETISAMSSALKFYKQHGFRPLPRPIGQTGHHHNDCWMLLDIPYSNSAC